MISLSLFHCYNYSPQRCHLNVNFKNLRRNAFRIESRKIEERAEGLFNNLIILKNSVSINYVRHKIKEMSEQGSCLKDLSLKEEKKVQDYIYISQPKRSKNVLGKERKRKQCFTRPKGGAGIHRGGAVRTVEPGGTEDAWAEACQPQSHLHFVH